MSPQAPKLFQPTQIGNITLNHRVVHAPLTRNKATKSGHVQIVHLVKEYYSQRSRIPGTFIIAEATFIAANAGGIENVPGIWSDEQINAWREVTDEVHRNGSHMFLQLWALGRAADPMVLTSEDPEFSLVAPSPIALSSQPIPQPRALTIAEIQQYVQLYAQAAMNAVGRAGFDGVEVHGGHGFLVDQFLQESSNKRTDEYGGSIEARSRFGLEVIDAISRAIGPERTAIRLSPWSNFQDMRASDPVPQFSHFVSKLKEAHPTLAYLHVIEPRVVALDDRIPDVHESNDFIRAIWEPLPLISAGGYTRESALQTAEEKGELIAFGRMYTSNPDLPVRLRGNIPLTPYNRGTFFTPGDQANAAVGYIDYEFAQENVEIHTRL